MLTHIRSRQEPGAPEGPADLLRGCHERIRRFGALALRLGEPAPADDRAAAALAVRRYFCEALPLHVADEDESMAPRLRGAGAAVAAALARMSAEHGPIEEAVAAAAPLWAALAAAPEDRALLAAVVAAGARLVPLLFRHIEAEEAELFPALAQLDEAAQAAMLAEMRGRRGATGP